jgi:fucose permease
MAACGLMALVGSLAAFILIKLQRGAAKAPSPHPFAWGKVWHNLILTAKDKQIWVGSLYGFFIFAMVNVFTSLWGVDFLEHTQALDRQSAANVMSMIFIGIAIGGPMLGLLTHRWVIHRQAMSYCALLSAILMSYLLWVPSLPLWGLYTGYTVMGMFCAAYIPCFTVIKDNAPSTIQATSLAFANMMIMAGAPVLQTLIGILLVHLGGAAHASAFAYRMALLILPLGMLVAWVLCFFIRDARPHATEAVLVK